jgi:hypothetical protein
MFYQKEDKTFLLPSNRALVMTMVIKFITCRHCVRGWMRSAHVKSRVGPNWIVMRGILSQSKLRSHGLWVTLRKAERVGQWPTFSRLGDVVVSVLVTRHKGRGFKPGRGDGNSHSFGHSQMSLLVGLPEHSGRRVRSYPQPESSSPRLPRSHSPGGWTIGQWWPQFWDIVSSHHNQSINHSTDVLC